MDILSDIVGYMASVCMILGYLPQAVHTIKTRDTSGIAYGTFLLMGLGAVFFVVQGFLTGNAPLWITNLVTSISSGIVFGIKVRNDCHKK